MIPYISTGSPNTTIYMYVHYATKNGNNQLNHNSNVLKRTKQIIKNWT